MCDSFMRLTRRRSESAAAQIGRTALTENVRSLDVGRGSWLGNTTAPSYAPYVSWQK
jgi:hypothetical protein